MYDLKDILDREIAIRCRNYDEFNMVLNFAGEEFDDVWTKYDRQCYQDEICIGFWSDLEKKRAFYLTEEDEEWWNVKTITVDQCVFLQPKKIDLLSFEEIVMK